MQTPLLKAKCPEAIALVKGDAFRIVEHSKVQTAGTRNFISLNLGKINAGVAAQEIFISQKLKPLLQIIVVVML